MSGPFGSSQWMYSSGGFYPHELGQSLRFNDNDSAYLSRTPSIAGNRKTWTWSGWVKRGNLGSNMSLMSAGSSNGASTRLYINISSSDKIDLSYGSGNFGVPSAVLRDTSAWYHLVIAFNSTDATASDRVKFYINGQRLTAFDSTPSISLNQDTAFNNTHVHDIGDRAFDNDFNFDGYMAEFNFIDGQALGPTDFGEFKSGVWVANEYTGSYGTNGFYLPFTNDYSVEGFNTVTYRGNGGTQYIGGVGFEPDLVWIKNRGSSGENHSVYDAVRPEGYTLYPNLTNAENTGVLLNLENDGFLLTTANNNISGDTYVAWAWDAGTGSAASNTDGSITSSVKANPDYGFSIVSYTGNGSTSATVGHGLSSAPEMVIVKNRDSSLDWRVYHTEVGATKYLGLNQTIAATTDTATWNNTAPTSSVFSIANSTKVNESGSNHIAYCFHSVSGYSDFGSYTGTGAAGNTVTTGFKPAFVMVKRTNVSGDSWFIFDNTREPTNPKDYWLAANLSNAETQTEYCDFTDTGFTVNSTIGAFNASGSTYIYMAFADKREAAFWLDQSGNNNDWTNNNMQESDISLDSPTNNFATWNVLTSGSTLSEGNLQVSTDVGNTRYSTFGVSSGKWYWEVRVSAQNGWFSLTNFSDKRQTTSTAIAIIYDGTSQGTYQAYSTKSYTAGDGWTAGDVLGFALDADTKTLNVYLNNTLKYTFDTFTVDGDYFFGSDRTNVGSDAHVLNFGQDSSFAGNKTAQGNTDDNGIGDFYYTPPSGGYLALCTANLPDPVIDPAQDDVPSDYFNTVLYTGNGSTQSITGVGFQPDWVWGKPRTTSHFHTLIDAVRGANTLLFSNSTAAEENLPDSVTSFDVDGFSLGNAGNVLNNSDESYVAWNWLAGNGTSSNTDGSITSTVSVNQKAGFSIVSYTGNGSTNQTVGHGLNSSPEFIVVKSRNTVATTDDSWIGYHKDLTASKKIMLNLTNAATDSGNWSSTDPTNSVFYVLSGNSGTNADGGNMISYCFHSVEGYSKFGSYTGNGSTDGPFVYTGFRPAWVMVKRTDGGTSGWYILDAKRNTYNALENRLEAHSSGAEATGLDIFDFVSNGFKLRDGDTAWNVSGGTYIFMAFAENPFKYSNAR